MSAPYKLPAPSTIRSRMLGSVYGLSVGDALGGPNEFQRRGTYTPSGEMEESDTFRTKVGKPLPKGSWTDDTSMALCLAESLRERKGFVWADAAEKCAFIVGLLRAPAEWSVKEKKEKILNKDFSLEDYLAPPAPSNPVPSAALAERLTSTRMRPTHVDETYKTKMVDEIRCSESVVHTLEAALWSLWQTEEGLLNLLPLGEDVDTVGAGYGAMAGAC
ncbi:hypothetical protein FS837_009831 [Tulasnella sp. UAMH 9824]|nr:hypothetical protein FS837_009831 [Tulasnella sp. UAMH 9824]